MSDGSVNDDSRETRLPDGRTIFDLITSNNLDAIRSLLTPLTLHERQMIVYQKIEHKTLLYHACEQGFKDIAKYLLDECGADVDDGYCDSSKSELPSRIAIKKLDVFLLLLLLKRRAALEKNNRKISCVYYAFKNRYYSLMSILLLYKNSLPNLHASESRENGYSVLSASYIYSDFRYNKINMDFLTAATNGDIARMKMLMATGLNKSFQNYAEENSMCLAILNAQRNTQHFLLNYKFYSLKSYALALELCGAKFVVFRCEKQKGLDCWKKALRIRRVYNIGFADKDSLTTARNLGIEFQTEDEVDALRDGNDLYSQALLVFLRILSKSSRVTQQAFKIVAGVKMLNADLLQTLNILSELYHLPTNNIRSPKSCALKTMAKLFDYHFSPNLKDTNEFLSRFRKLSQLLNAATWEVFLRSSVEFTRIAYGKLLDIILIGLGYMDSHNLSEEQKKWIENEIRKMAGKCSYPYPTTLMHKAIVNKVSLCVVSFLLKCFGDANCSDACKTTPLHLISRLPKENPYLYYMSHLFIEAGGHVDSVNSFGNRPLEALKRKGVIENPLHFLSLQCLAARVIYKSRIIVSEKFFPKILVEFINLHSV